MYAKRGSGGAWESCGKENVKCLGGATAGVVRDFAVAKLQEGKHQDLVDFSEHVCDVTKDWRNVDMKV